jgi:hypothetical protein
MPLGTVFIPPVGRGPSVDIGQTSTGSNSNELVLHTVKYGQESRRVFFDTFFDEFKFTCVPRYVRYVPNESDDDSWVTDVRESNRHIVLSWRSAPKLPTHEYAQVNDVDVGSFEFNTIPGLTEPPSPQSTTFANMSFNPGSATVKISDPIPDDRLSVPSIDEEAVLASYDMSGARVAELISNASETTANSVVVDNLGTLAVVSAPVQDRFTVFRLPTVQSVPRESNTVLFGQAALGILSLAPTEVDTREHIETSLVVSAFSTEVALMDALDDQADEQSVEPPGEPTTQVRPSLTYVGYVIERQKMSADGVFVDDKRFIVSGVDKMSFIDTGVAYGRV